MTMRVILLVRGSLAHGGSFAGSSGPSTGAGNVTVSGNGPRDGPYRITAGTGNQASLNASSKRGVHTTASGAQASLAGTNPASRPQPTAVKMSQPTFAVPQGENGYDDEGADADIDIKKSHAVGEEDEEEGVFEGEGKRREAWD